MLTIHDTFQALIIAIAAIVIAWVMTDEGMLLQRPYEWLKARLEDKHNWLWYPLGGCPKCFAGQLAFWEFLYYNEANYDIFRHLLFTTTTIFIAYLLMKLYSKI